MQIARLIRVCGAVPIQDGPALHPTLLPGVVPKFSPSAAGAAGWHMPGNGSFRFPGLPPGMAALIPSAMASAHAMAPSASGIAATGAAGTTTATPAPDRPAEAVTGVRSPPAAPVPMVPVIQRKPAGVDVTLTNSLIAAVISGTVRACSVACYFSHHSWMLCKCLTWRGCVLFSWTDGCTPSFGRPCPVSGFTICRSGHRRFSSALIWAGACELLFSRCPSRCC